MLRYIILEGNVADYTWEMPFWPFSKMPAQWLEGEGIFDVFSLVLFLHKKRNFTGSLTNCHFFNVKSRTHFPKGTTKIRQRYTREIFDRPAITLPGQSPPSAYSRPYSNLNVSQLND